MSFWRTFGFHTISTVDAILDREDFTLQELLEEEEFLQEVKSQNRKLLEYLTEPDVLRELVQYITTEAPEDADSKRRFKYPFLACEVLCSEVWAICEAIYKDESLLSALYGFLAQPPPLSPLLASYVCRVAGVLLQRKIGETIAFMKKESMVDNFIKHLSNAAVMDLLLKVISCEETAEGAGILAWLCSTELIPCLMSKFDPALTADVHENAAQALVDIISVSGSATGSPLMAQLESAAVIESLYGHILAGAKSTALLNGLTVAIELIARNAVEAHNADASLEQLPPLLRVTAAHLARFLALLTSDDKLRRPFSTGEEVEVFGFHKLKVIEFFAAVARTNYRCVNEQLLELTFFTVAIDLFFHFPWHNFLHATVEQMLLSVFESDNLRLKLELVRATPLLTRL